MTSDPRQQRGFTLLIGLMLLTGMTLMATYLAERGLLDTRFAFNAVQRLGDFQQQDGEVEAALADRNALIGGNFNLACSADFTALGADGADIALGLRRLCPAARLPEPSPTQRERLVRLQGTSYGAQTPQTLSQYRYFELRAVSPDDGGEALYQGIVTLATGGAS